MKPTLAALGVCLVLGACGSLPHQATAADARAKESSPRERSYPYSEIAKVYDTVFDALTDKYFSKHPELDKEHTAKLKSFIKSECPREKFVKQIVRDEYVAKFDRAVKDKAYRDTKEFKDAFTIMVSVSVRIAEMQIGGLRDVYVSKYIEKDPIKTSLFEIASDEQRQYVSWVYGEVTVDKFRKEAGDKHAVQKGDRFYGFMSPPSTWEKRHGREGFLHVRGEKIIEVVVTAMN